MVVLANVHASSKRYGKQQLPKQLEGISDFEFRISDLPDLHSKLLRYDKKFEIRNSKSEILHCLKEWRLGCYGRVSRGLRDEREDPPTYPGRSAW